MKPPGNNIPIVQSKIDTGAIPVKSHSLIRSFAEPKGKVFLLYGDSPIFRFSLVMAAQAVSRGASIAVIDGCNRFDVHTVTRFARERRLDPDALLRRIFVSRGFTCYQMEAAVNGKLPAFLARTNSNTALIFGLLDTFYDEQAPLREVQHILTRVLSALQAMRAGGISLLLASSNWKVLPEERNQLFARLKTGMDRVYRLAAGDENTPQLFLEYHDNTTIKKGAPGNGTNRANLYEHHR